MVEHPNACNARPRSPLGWLPALATAFGFLAFPHAGGAAESRIDPRLRAMAESGAETLTVWIEFHDKGERSEADLADRLAAAARALTPRARSRRLRAGVSPLVDPRDLPVDAGYLAEVRRRGLQPLAVSRWFNRVAARVPAAALSEIATLPFVRDLAPVERALRSVDPPLGGSEGMAVPRAPGPEALAAVDHGRHFDPLAQIGVTGLHHCGFDGAGVLVCVLDDGFRWHDVHEALRDQPIASGHRRDFVDGDTLVADAGAGVHGTLVLGAIAANRSGAYVGSAYGASFALARTERASSETPAEMLYWGMGAEWADSLGADIISSSVGYYVFDDPAADYTYADMDGRTTDVSRAALIAARKGILVVNAIGNLGNSPWRYLIAPADVDGDSLIAVGAVTQFGDTAGFSSAGPTADGRVKPDLVARGESNPVVVAGADPGAYGSASGTSVATPLIAGAAACLMQARPEWTPREVIRALRSTASRAANPDFKMGYGIPDAVAAYQWPDTTPSTPSGPFEARLTGSNPVRLSEGPARLEFALARGGPSSDEVRVRVLDPQGRAVRTLWRGTLCVGQRPTAVWDGRGENGASRSGVYWIVVEGQGGRRATKLVALE